MILFRLPLTVDTHYATHFQSKTFKNKLQTVQTNATSFAKST